MSTPSSITSNMPPTRISPTIPETIVHNSLTSHHQNPLASNRTSNIYQEGHYIHSKSVVSPSPEHPESSKRTSPENEYIPQRTDTNSAQTVPQQPTKQSVPLDANRMLHVYIYDFLKKKQYNQTANQFLLETCLPLDTTRVPIDIQEGFLIEWWTVFWEIFSTRTAQTSPDASQVSYSDMLSIRNEFEKKHKFLHSQVQQQQHYIQSISQNDRLSVSDVHNQGINISSEESQILLDEKTESSTERFSPRNNHSEQSTPSCSSEPNSGYNASISTSLPSSATKELDSLNLEEKRIWLSQLQQRSAAMLSPAMMQHSGIRHVSYQQQSNVTPSPMMINNTQSQPPVSHPSPTKRFRPDIDHSGSSNVISSFQHVPQQPIYSTTPVQMVVQHRPQTHAGMQHRPVQSTAAQGQIVYQRNTPNTNAMQNNPQVQQVMYHPQMQSRPQTMQVQVPSIGVAGNQNIQVMMMQQQQRMPRQQKQSSQSQQMMMVAAAMQPGGQQQFVVVPQQQQAAYSNGGSPSQSSTGRPQAPMVILNNLPGNATSQVSGNFQSHQVMMHQQAQHPMVMHQQQMQMQSSNNVGFNKTSQIVHNPQNGNIMYQQQQQVQMQQNMGGMMNQYVVQSGSSNNIARQSQSNVAIDKTALEISYFAGLTSTAPGVQNNNMMTSTIIEGQSQTQIDDDTIDQIEETLLGDLDDLFSQDTMTDSHMVRKHDNIESHPEGSYS